MDHDPELENWLRDTQAPRVVESPHRARLKTELLQQFRKEKPIMFRGIFKNRRIAWALGLFLLCSVVATAWATYFAVFVVNTETIQTPEGLVDVVTCIATDDPNVTPETASQMNAEIKQLITEKKYVFLAEKEVDDQTIYTYEFTLSNGETVATGFPKALD